MAGEFKKRVGNGVGRILVKRKRGKTFVAGTYFVLDVSQT